MHAVAVLLLLVQAPVLQKDGLQFKDLNRNGVVDPYEDWRLSPAQRAHDLVARMTLEEKAGTMMHGTVRALGGLMASAGMGGQYDTASARALIDSVKVTSLITRLNADPGTLAAANNVLQAIAERTRLCIPLTISTDPRNHFQYLPGVSSQTTFSQWPEALGFAAVDDTALTRAFGDIARQEYRAVGIHMALSPQADLATEPRWPRVGAPREQGRDPAAEGRPKPSASRLRPWDRARRGDARGLDRRLRSQAGGRRHRAAECAVRAAPSTVRLRPVLP